MKQLKALVVYVRRRLMAFPVMTRRIIILALCAGAAFGGGLLYFYIPARPYGAVHEVWLPQLAGGRDQILMLPVTAKVETKQTDKYAAFSTAYSGPTVLVSNISPRLEPDKCPNIFRIDELSPSDCVRVGYAGNSPVYSIRRRLPSDNVEGFMARGKSFIAVTGMTSEPGIVNYFESLHKVPKHRVDKILKENKAAVARVAEAIKKEKRAAAEERARAYLQLPFHPALPTALPAGWKRASITVEGSSVKLPNQVSMNFSKGDGQSVTMQLVPKKGFTVGATCGPAPYHPEPLQCAQVGLRDYYTAGDSGQGNVRWYIFRPVGDAVAVLFIDSRRVEGVVPIYGPDEPNALDKIAMSLKPVSKDRLKGAEFVAPSYYDPYPEIRL